MSTNKQVNKLCPHNDIPNFAVYDSIATMKAKVDFLIVMTKIRWDGIERRVNNQERMSVYLGFKPCTRMMTSRRIFFPKETLFRVILLPSPTTDSF